MKLILLLISAVSLSAQTSAFFACGNPNPYTDSTAQVWAADSGSNCTGGTTFHSSNAIQGTADPTLYQFGRQGNALSATASLTVGVYRIQLKFADVLGPARPGSVIFNIFVNGTFQQSFDMYQTIRALNTAYDVVIPVYANLTGTLTVQMFQVSGWAQLQAVSFTSVGGGGGISAINVSSNGTPVGAATTLNYVAGTGILNGLASVGSQVNLTQSIDPAQVVTNKIGTIQFPTVQCSSGAATAGVWVLNPVTDAATCLGVTFYGFINMGATGTRQGFAWFRWPSDFNSFGQVNVYVTLTDNAGSGGNIKLDFSLGCINAGAAVNSVVTFNPASTTGAYSLTSVGVANVTKELTISALNTTGCSPKQFAVLLMNRDTAVASNSVDVLNIINVTMEYARN